MYLVYIDEVKPQARIEPYYWLCALAFPEQIILEVEAKMAALASCYFESPILNANTEFHAVDILNGKGVNKGRGLDQRITIFKSLIDLIAAYPGIGKVVVRIDVQKMISAGYEDKAFMFLVEKVDALMNEKKSLAMLIADHDKDMVVSNVGSLSRYKESGTNFCFGRDIKHIADTIHHTPSHHSRLIQLTDIYAYAQAMCFKAQEKYPRNELSKYVKGKDILFPSKYKVWPTAQSWHKL